MPWNLNSKKQYNQKKPGAYLVGGAWGVTPPQLLEFSYATPPQLLEFSYETLYLLGSPSICVSYRWTILHRPSCSLLSSQLLFSPSSSQSVVCVFFWIIPRYCCLFSFFVVSPLCGYHVPVFCFLFLLCSARLPFLDLLSVCLF